MSESQGGFPTIWLPDNMARGRPGTGKLPHLPSVKQKLQAWFASWVGQVGGKGCGEDLQEGGPGKQMWWPLRR